jgi:hypothetical protein
VVVIGILGKVERGFTVRERSLFMAGGVALKRKGLGKQNFE